MADGLVEIHVVVVTRHGDSLGLLTSSPTSMGQEALRVIIQFN